MDGLPLSREPLPVAVTVALPVLGDPTAVVATAVRLAEHWPVDLDADLVVATGRLRDRDRAVLAELEGDVRFVVREQWETLGELAVTAAGATTADAVLVVAPGAELDADVLSTALSGTATPDAVLLSREVLLTSPVLTSAADVRSLAALARPALQPRPAPDLPAPPALEAAEVSEGLVSVVIATRDALPVLRTCLEHLRRHTTSRHEVVVIDAGSGDGTLTYLRGRREVRVVRAPRNTSPDAALNLGIQAAQGDVVVLLEPSTVVHKFWLEGLLRPLEADGDVVAVGARSNSAPGVQAATATEYRTGSEFQRVSRSWRRTHRGAVRETHRLTGPCVAVRRTALQRTGLLHEVFDIDGYALTALSARLRACGRLVIADEVLVHQDAETRWRSSRATQVEQVQTLRALLRHAGLPLLSATLIVKDEQRSLAVALDSLHGVVDEVVVSDTGSTDRTVEIATAMGARVVHRPWTNDFAAARNHAHAEARGLWALYLDADERLVTTPHDADDLALQLLQSPHDGISAPLQHFGEDGITVDMTHLVLRLLRRETLQWRGVVHESPVRRDGGQAHNGATEMLRVVHEGYRKQVFQEKDKAARNLRLARANYERNLVEDGGRWRWKGAYELARTLVGKPDSEAELEARLRECLDGVPATAYHLRADALLHLSALLLGSSRPEEALTSAEEAQRLLPHNARTALAVAQAHVALDAGAAGLAALESFCPQQGAGGGDMLDLGAEHVELPTLRARLLLAEGEPARALDVLTSTLEQHADRFGGWDVLQRALQQTQGERWAVRLGELCAASPERALLAYSGLEEPKLLELEEGLRRRGVDAEQHSPQGRYREQLVDTLRGHTPEVVAATALKLEEDGESAHALALWERLPATAAVRVARARCLLDLDRIAEAADSLDDLQVSELTGPDLLAVAVVAAAAGDSATAVAVLSGLPDDADLAEDAVALCRALGADPARELPEHLVAGIPA